MEKLNTDDIAFAAKENAEEYDRMYKKVAEAAFREGAIWMHTQMVMEDQLKY